MNVTSADRDYFLRSAFFMTGYTAFLIASFTGAFDGIHRGTGWILALIAAAPVVGHLWAFLCWLHRSDEFVRTLAAKRFIITTGMVFAAMTAWGLLEMHARAPHFPPGLTVPLFWLVWAGVSPFIRTSHA